MFQINYNLVLFSFQSFILYKLLKNKHIVVDETCRTGCGYFMFPLEKSVPGHLLLNILWHQFSLADQTPQHAAAVWQSPANMLKADRVVENSVAKEGKNYSDKVNVSKQSHNFER